MGNRICRAPKGSEQADNASVAGASAADGPPFEKKVIFLKLRSTCIYYLGPWIIYLGPETHQQKTKVRRKLTRNLLETRAWAGRAFEAGPALEERVEHNPPPAIKRQQIDTMKPRA